MTYGPSGLGKTSDEVAAFPSAFFIGQPRAFRSAEALWGFEIPTSRIAAAENLKDTIKLAAEATAKGLDVVVDDLSPLVEYTVAQYEKKASGYDVYKFASTDLLALRELTDKAKRHLVMNAHLGQPKTNKLNGRPIRGGPRLPGQMTEIIVTAFDTVLQLEADPMRAVGHQASYLCKPTEDASYAFKDRFVTAELLVTNPPNVRELLNMAGFKFARPPGLEWIDTVAENIAQLLVGKMALDPASVAAAPGPGCVMPDGRLHIQVLNNKPALGGIVMVLRQAIAGKYSQDLRHQNWAIRDGIDRATIRAMVAIRRSGPQSLYGG